MRTVVLYEAECSNAVIALPWAFPGILQALDVGIPLEVAWPFLGILSHAPFAGVRDILLVGVCWEWELVNCDVDDRFALPLADSLKGDRVVDLSC